MTRASLSPMHQARGRRAVTPSVASHITHSRREIAHRQRRDRERGTAQLLSNRHQASRRRRDRERPSVGVHSQLSIEHDPAEHVDGRQQECPCGQHLTKRHIAQRRRRERERRLRDIHAHSSQEPNFPHNVHGDTLTPAARRRYVEPVEQLSFGPMNVKCASCAALHWADERLKQSSLSSPQFSRCCHHGKVDLDPLPPPPEHLQQLFTATSTEARQFRENIRRYNATLAFTSVNTIERTTDSSSRQSRHGSSPIQSTFRK